MYELDEKLISVDMAMAAGVSQLRVAYDNRVLITIIPRGLSFVAPSASRSGLRGSVFCYADLNPATNIDYGTLLSYQPLDLSFATRLLTTRLKPCRGASPF